MRHTTEVELETLVNMDGKAMWDKLKELGPKLNQSRIPEEVVVDGKIITQSEEVMNHLVQCFTELYTDLPDNAAGYDQSCLEKARSSKKVIVIEESILNSLITNEEVTRVVHRSKRGKAVSVDLVPNGNLKNSSSVNMLTNFYNYCFQNGLIPNDWKKAILSPIYKGGNKLKSDPLVCTH